MKKILLVSILSLFIGFVNAQTFTSGGLKYKIVGQNTAVVAQNPNFSGNAVLTNVVKDSVNVPYIVTAIVDSAFFGNKNLTSINISSNVTTIGKAAFAYCSGLTEVIQTNALVVIEEYTFAACNKLTNINLKNSQVIKELAFVDCNSLKNIELSYDLASIGDRAFYNCFGLETITTNNITPPVINTSVFLSVDINKITLLVPGNRELAYDTVPIWTDFKIFSTQPFEFGDFYYITTSSSTVKLSGLFNTISTAKIPSSITRNGITYSVTAIGDNAFNNGNNITSVTIPNTVKSIGNKAFYYNSFLSSVTLSNTLESIGDSAFMNTSVTSIAIPSSVKTLGKSVFENCISLGSVSLSTSLTSLPDRAFNQCRGLKSISIPNSVTDFGKEVFEQCTGLTSVTLPNTLKSISTNAFNYCSSLNKVTLPNSITKIDTNAFSNCTKLTTITLSNTLQIIRNSAFEYSGITVIDIPASVTTIEPTAFNNCTGLTSITVNNLVPLEVDPNLFYPIDYTNLILNVPAESVQAYKAKAPWKFFNIPNYQFFTINGINYGRINATEVEVKRHITFNGAVTIPSSVLYFGKTYTVKQIADSAFCGTYITEVSLPNTITNIGKYAFKGTYLSKIKLPTSLLSISDEAFNTIYTLQSVTFPNSLTSIGKDAFNNTSLNSISFPSSITSIGQSAFANITTLQTVFAEWSTPLVLDATTFQGIALSSVNLYVPDASKSLYASANVWKDFNAAVLTSISYQGILYNITGANTLSVGNNSSFVGEAIIPSGFTFLSKNYIVNEMKDSAFLYSQELTKVVIPNSITKIGNHSFNTCQKLVSVSFPSTLKSIGIYAFSSCNMLETITIPNGVTSIGNYAFTYCSGLLTVSIPNTVTSIGISTFSQCSQLKYIYVNWLTPISITANVFTFVNKANAKLYVPYGRSSVYAAALVWKDFPKVENDKFTANGINFQFTSATTVVVGKNPDAKGNVNIPSTVVYNGQTYKVTAIVDSAFYGNKGLKSVTFSNKTITIARLSSIDTLSSLKTIGKHAFEGCDSLAIIEIPDSVVAIGDSAFANCIGLKDVKVNWNTPLAINETIFEGVNTADVNLFVPSVSKSTYSNTVVWKEFRIGVVSQVDEISTKNTVNIYPNPFVNFVSVNLDNFDTSSSLEIFDLQGNIIQKTILSASQNFISTENLSAGVYVFKISGNKQVHIEKLIKN